MISSFLRSRLALAFIPIIAVVYCLTVSANVYTTQVHKETNMNALIVSAKPKPATGSPSNFSAADNFAIAAGVFNDYSYFSSVTSGKVVARVGIKYVQNVSFKRVAKEELLWTEANSISAFKKVAEQKFYSPSVFLLLKASSFSGNKANYKTNVSRLEKETHAANYGAVPKEICKYVVNKGTILSSETLSSTASAHVFSLFLDPAASTEFYRLELKTLAGGKSAPKFSSVKLTFEIDDNWNILKITAEENYKIDLLGFGNIKCEGSLSEVFSDHDSPSGVLPSEANIFLSFL